MTLEREHLAAQLRHSADADLFDILAHPDDYSSYASEVAGAELRARGYPAGRIDEEVADIVRREEREQQEQLEESSELHLNYPSLARRCVTVQIDVLLVLASFFALAYALKGSHWLLAGTRVALLLGMWFLYEPIMTSRACTLGQFVTGIRVRRWGTLKRISLPQAFGRILLKSLLGVISFFAVSFSRDRRAIHDLASRTIVVYVAQLGAIKEGGGHA
jgi:uncharacterized RDD family membrane protein YckC